MILGAGKQQDLQGFSIIHVVQYDLSEMQKAADAADISVLFFSAGANFGVIFGPFFGAHFLWQNMHLCYLNRFLQLCSFQPWFTLESSCLCIKSLESSLLCVLFMALIQ